jgi:hypothetical protein
MFDFCCGDSVVYWLDCGLDDRGIVVQLPAASTLDLGPNKPRIQLEPGAFSLAVNHPVRDFDHSPASSAEVKNEWHCTSISSPSMPLWHAQGQPFALLCKLCYGWFKISVKYFSWKRHIFKNNSVFSWVTKELWRLVMRNHCEYADWCRQKFLNYGAAGENASVLRTWETPRRYGVLWTVS